jgi:hypothetical protein
MTRHSLQGLGGDLKGEAITEGEAQYLGRGKTDGTVGARIGRIRGSFGGQRNPIFIGVRVGITIGACCLNSSDRSPELIGVLSFEKSDCSIRQADVQQSKQSGYTRVFNEVKSLGEIDSKTRTSDQTVIGNFWNGNIQDFWTLCGRFR